MIKLPLEIWEMMRDEIVFWNARNITRRSLTIPQLERKKEEV